MTPKQKENFDELNRRLTELYQMDAGIASSIVQEVLLKARRLRNRLAVPQDAQRVEFAPERGPIVEFTGRQMFGKDINGHNLEFWVTLSGEWIVYSSWPLGSRVWTFRGEERRSESVLGSMGYSIAASKLAKGMGWDRHVEID